MSVAYGRAPLKQVDSYAGEDLLKTYQQPYGWSMHSLINTTCSGMPLTNQPLE
jgi:hypothetical protein